MISKRSDQLELYDVGNVFDVQLPAGSFHSQLAAVASHLFKDEDFAAFYSAKMGRPSVPPSLLALVVLLQAEAQVSDAEAIFRTAYDLRWAAVLHKPAGTQLCAKSTLQLFRTHLCLHPEVQAIYLASIAEAKRAGLLKGNALRIAIDTKPVRGRGAVEDTFNLVATGIRQLARAIAKINSQKLDDFLRSNNLTRYTEASVKGSADLDWSDEQAREALLTQLVADARHLLKIAGSYDTNTVRDAASLLEQLMLQDIETKKANDGSEQCSIINGTAKGRMPSATDPEVRHGRKSATKRFNGHKADIAVDQDSQVIVGFNVLAGDAGDASGSLDIVKQVEANTGQPVEQTTADCAYGGAPTRQQFEDAGRVLLAKVPKEHSQNGMFCKSAFTIDTENNTVTCPANQIAARVISHPDGSKTFHFGSACSGCELRSQCTRSKHGRTILVSPQEEVIRAARQYQKTPEGRATLRARFVVEHRLARLAQLGIGQARYKGRRKTRFQLMLACTLANLRLAWNTVAKNGAKTPWDPPNIAFWQPDVPRTALLEAISQPICKLLAFSNAASLQAAIMAA